jgi:hypothetical protein
MTTDRDPDHPILPQAWEWEIIGLDLQRAPEDDSEPHLDLTLLRGEERRRLRFWSPRDLSIEAGGPRMTHGLEILDTSQRGMEGCGVQVDDFEGDFGAVRFWARAVEQLP